MTIHWMVHRRPFRSSWSASRTPLRSAIRCGPVFSDGRPAGGDRFRGLQPAEADAAAAIEGEGSGRDATAEAAAWRRLYVLNIMRET
jgi:hypothetical protein